jgi:hypothetical protein
VESSNRIAFVNKKIIQELTQQRELQLLKQKEEHENLIYSIFPPVVAKVLIKKQIQKIQNIPLLLSQSHRDFRGGMGVQADALFDTVCVPATSDLTFTRSADTLPRTTGLPHARAGHHPLH